LLSLFHQHYHHIHLVFRVWRISIAVKTEHHTHLLVKQCYCTITISHSAHHMWVLPTLGFILQSYLLWHKNFSSTVYLLCNHVLYEFSYVWFLCKYIT
jgi:hypothetical protein